MQSAKKRLRQEKKRTLRNRGWRTQLKNAVKKVRVATEKNDATTAKQALASAIPQIDKTASKGVIHKRKAARLISRLTKQVNNLS